MNREYWFDTDLAKAVISHDLPWDALGIGPNGSHDNVQIGIRLYHDGKKAEVSISSTIFGQIILSDGTMVEGIAGGRSRYTLWITVPGIVYEYPGNVEIFIKMRERDETTTVGCVRGKVRNLI